MFYSVTNAPSEFNATPDMFLAEVKMFAFLVLLIYYKNLSAFIWVQDLRLKSHLPFTYNRLYMLGRDNNLLSIFSCSVFI